ncbi:MAG TPA: ABC transporter substrate-binding protein [Stackebrandtia sp.]|jgi:iron complex transport system substrate-binding protein|uniref:ABC transporter substrate-binding protein n=1 Tax=Stackebrandtia sp. TaxID=2023065 RepID=UPI002D69155E|nr:ABC transporter substrate-binding protein [Stackebrandtia sp.]HZE40468.1 ABC transporter substrate-binding protein [Stackebrandtia sp.]
MRSRSLARTVAVVAIAAIGLSGCAHDSSTKDTGKQSYSAAGITLDAKPKRIVSLSATATEMLFAIDAGKQVKAVDSTSDYPKDAPKTKLNAFTPNVESIVGYKPDLVVLSNDQQGIVKKLKKAKVPTYLAPAATALKDTYQQITDLGALTGHKADATKLDKSIKSDISGMVSKLPKTKHPLTAYYELDAKFFSLTSTTFAGSLLKQAGLTNIADKAKDATKTGGYPQLSAEYVLDANPDMIFVAGGSTTADVTKRPGWKSVEAVKDGNVVALDDDVASRWGPRVVDLMKDITDAVSKASK